MSNFSAQHGMETYDNHPEGELANDEFFERLDKMIRDGGNGRDPDWLSADLAIVLYRNVREEEGWYKPQAIETVKDLKALPVQSVVRDNEGVVYEVGDSGFYAAVDALGEGNFYYASQINLPVNVLYVGESHA